MNAPMAQELSLGAERQPDWAQWNASQPYTIGVEEELMVLLPQDWSLANRAEDVLTRLPEPLLGHASPETHQAAIELATSPHGTVPAAATEVGALRAGLTQALDRNGLAAAGAGTHPLAQWMDTEVSRGARYRVIHDTMRELARREPTFALHVHVGVADAERAVTLYNRLRPYLPLLLAISANSPFWQGRDTGMASARTPIFQAFPRVGVPRAFPGYSAYVEVVDQLLRCGAFPAPTFLWWDVRLQPTLGTVELRVMDAQATAGDTAALAGLVQSIARLELERGGHDVRRVDADELIGENRFRAARDGMDAELLDPIAERPVPARRVLAELLEEVSDHAQDLGCLDQLAAVSALAAENGATRQRRLAQRCGLRDMIARLSSMFPEAPAARAA